MATVHIDRLLETCIRLGASDIHLHTGRPPVLRMDGRLMAEWKSLAAPFERECNQRARSGVADPRLDEFRWLLEELRVALFAQELRTPMPVSVKRLQKIWESRTHG